MNTILEEQRIQLLNIRGWITDQLPSVIDNETRNYLFEARQAIGFAMLHLERVDYRTGGFDSENQVEQPPASGGDGDLMTND
jgi:tRNA G37 N-methylase TrmD